MWRFQIALRKAEFASNKRGIWVLYKLWRKYIFHNLSVKLGLTIPINVFGPGLSISHYGIIVVNANAKVGKNCRIQEGVNIGSSSPRMAPIIGDNTFIGSEAKIIGEIEIANGAGSVVTKSFLEYEITIAGNPARKISNKGLE